MEKGLLILAKEYYFIKEALADRDSLTFWQYEELYESFVEMNWKIINSKYSFKQFNEAVQRYKEMTIEEYIRIMKGEKARL